MRFDHQPHHNCNKAVIYCRVSSKAQVRRGDGLGSQETRCRQYAEYRGYDVVGVFTDDLTGQRRDRPGVNALISFLQGNSGDPHVVIIDEVSRFARRVPIHFELRETIKQAGGILESPSMEFKDDADSEFNEYIQASAAQYQARKNREQTLNRMKARCYNGYWVFQPPIGFKYGRADGHGKILVRNEPIASLVQEALEGYASGRFDTQAEVKRFLETQPAFPKDLPKGQIRNQRIRDMLDRVVYAGYVEAPKWDISLREGKHEGLITLETFDKIQTRLKGGARAPARKDINQDFPLRGFVTCGDCGKPLTACWSKSSTGKRHPYYFCHNRACESHRKSIPRDRIEDAFAELLHGMQPTRGLYDLTRAMFKKAWSARLSQAEAAKIIAQKQETEIEKQIELLVDRIVESDSTTAISAYEKRIAKLEKEKLILAEKRTNGMVPKHSFEEMFERAMLFLSNPCKLWTSERLEDKRAVLKLTFASRLPYSRENGFRTPQTSVPFRFLENFASKCEMARSGRFELPTPRFVVWCSIQLSYERLALRSAAVVCGVREGFYGLQIWNASAFRKKPVIFLI